MRDFINQGLGSHDHSRGAKTALNGTMVHKRLLQWMQSCLSLKPLYCLYLAAVYLNRQTKAGIKCLAINEHSARSAVAGIATFFGASVPQPVA